ncbi:MAG TPA: hypothetical protein VHB79_18760 [Polyangiaceae bacterium]|nr:hypothetical protein [Polyangiaceae bacterium]
MNTLRFGAVLAMVAATMFACSGDDDDVATRGAAGAAGAADEAAGGAKSDAAPLEIIGDYVDDFMQQQTITAKDWNGAAIVDYDNEANVVYTQNPDDAMFAAGKFAKTVYTEPTKAGEFSFCQIVYDADTLEDAKASTKVADDSDLTMDGKGCNGFSWSKASPK